MKKFPWMIVLFAVVLASVFSTVRAAALPVVSDPTRPEASYEAALLKLINTERSGKGLAALEMNIQLAAAAESHSADMAAKRYFSHVSANSSTFMDRIQRAGYNPQLAGETLYAGGDPLGTPEKCLQGWLNSPPHRAILLNPDFTQIGIGYVYDPASPYGSYYTADMAKPR